MKSLSAELLLGVVTIIWGATFSFTKLGLDETSPFFYLFLRFLLAFSLLLIIFWRQFLQIKRETFFNGLVLGLFFGGGFVLQTLGLKFTSVTKSAFITGMAVVITPFVFWLIIRKPVKFWQKAGVIVAFIGLWLFANPDFDNINIGDILTFLSTVFWGFYITYMDIFTKKVTYFRETIQLVMMQFVVILPISFAGTVIFESGSIRFIFSEMLIYSLLFNGIVASIFLTIIHTAVQKYTTPVKAALIFSLEPVFASLIAFVVFKEILSGKEYLGAFILFSGVLLSEGGEYLQKIFNRKKV